MDYDETQSIGRRYRRQDEIGTPYCVTVDFDSLADNAVTVRDRDTMKQDRIPVDDFGRVFARKVNLVICNVISKKSHFKKKFFSNGLTLVTADLDSTEAVTVVVYVKVGSRYEQAKIQGIAHFLEHVVLLREPKIRPSASHITKELERNWS